MERRKRHPRVEVHVCDSWQWDETTTAWPGIRYCPRTLL